MAKKWRLEEKNGYCLIINEGGATLGISAASKEFILEIDGFAFKDMNRNGTLEPYEDWRLPMEERVADLVKRLSIEEIAGLMLYSSHQMLSMDTLSEAQKSFLTNDNIRHVLVAMMDSTATAAKWNNNAQAFVEKLGHGIPINTSSDPRHAIAASAEFDMGAGGEISKWPEHIGLAATFDPALMEEFGRVASREYRAMGIATALSPQIDISSDPRWNRFSGCFGSGSKLVADLGRAYCDGFQTSAGKSEIANGWGYDSVNAMCKHWPGGGTGEGGRDAHFGYGKYAVYPGGNFEDHLKPFTEGAFKLNGKTECASAVMPYYTISYNIDKENKENVGNSYSKYIITTLLRGKYGYNGVVCTDWGITYDISDEESIASGKCWGVEDLSVADRHYKVLMAGVDQFGGNSDAKPVIAAYKKGVARIGEASMRQRMEESAARILKNIFRVGLFENPYVDIEQSAKTIGCEDFLKKGYKAQQRSVVMLKNKDGVLPIKNRAKVYIPMRHTNAGLNWFGLPFEAKDEIPTDLEAVKKYFDVVDTPEQADCAFAFIISPSNKGYSKKEGFLPISLQYRPYKAEEARETSIAPSGNNRSYKGKTVTTCYEPHLDMVLSAKKAMGNKPVIVFLKMLNPTIPEEFEHAANAILIDFCVKPEALMDIVSGMVEPSGLLPCVMPKDMAAVERHNEDVSFDIEPYTDECNNTYRFAFGLNWNGVIDDERVHKYRQERI